MPRFAVVGILAWAVLGVSGCVTNRDDEAPPHVPESPPVVREGIRFDTELGSFVLILYPEAAPQTVELMRAYVEESYYVGREFTRVVPGHVIQVLDVTGEATEDERRVPLEAHADYHFSAGAVGIARGEDPGSGGPEFFVMDFGTSHLDGNYTVWGQVVEGLDVVHQIARVDAVDLSPIPGAANPFVDRMAVDPVAITAASVVDVSLASAVNDTLPLRVATNARSGDYRHSLEWPRNLEGGRAANLTWFVRAYNGTILPAPEDVRVRLDGEERSVVGDPDAAGMFRFAWTPTSPGDHNATLLVGGDAWATLRVRHVGPA